MEKSSQKPFCAKQWSQRPELQAPQQKRFDQLWTRRKVAGETKRT